LAHRPRPLRAKEKGKEIEKQKKRHYNIYPRALRPPSSFVPPASAFGFSVKQRVGHRRERGE